MSSPPYMLAKLRQMIVHGAEAETCFAGVPAGVRRVTVRTGLAIGALMTARFVPFLSLVLALIGVKHPYLLGVLASLPHRASNPTPVLLC